MLKVRLFSESVLLYWADSDFEREPPSFFLFDSVIDAVLARDPFPASLGLTPYFYSDCIVWAAVSIESLASVFKLATGSISTCVTLLQFYVSVSASICCQRT